MSHRCHNRPKQNKTTKTKQPKHAARDRPPGAVTVSNQELVLGFRITSLRVIDQMTYTPETLDS